MKLKHILINILPLLLFVVYYIFSMSKNKLYLMPIDEWLVLVLLVAFTIYNFKSCKIINALVRNLVLNISVAGACYISGLMYLNFCPHMSDEHHAVSSITLDIFIGAVVITIIAALMKYFINKIKSKKGKNNETIS